MASTRERTDAEELAQLRAVVAEQQQRLDALEGKTAPEKTKEQRATRRQMLKMAGATLAGAAGAAALRAVPAAAADGDPMTVAGLMFEPSGNVTELVQTATTSYHTGFLTTTASYSGIGVQGQTYGGSYGKGVYGYSTNNGVGVFGSHGFTGAAGYGAGFGVFGRAYNGTGVFAESTYFGIKSYASSTTGIGAFGSGRTGMAAYTAFTGGVGLHAYAYSGSTNATGVVGYAIATGGTGVYGAGHSYGVFGSATRTGVLGASGGGYTGVAALSNGGPDFKAFGTGRFVAVPNISGGVYGAPSFTPTYNYLETVRGKDGSMWLSRNQGAGQAAWKKVSAVRSDSDDGAGTAYKPFRIIDTRGSQGGFPGPHGTGSHTFQIAGVGTGKQHIPSDAVAVFGNITIVGFSGTGWATIAPAGAGTNPVSDPSSVNWGPGMAPAIANSFFVGLGTGTNAGKVTVYVERSSGSNVNYIVDITGYAH